MLDGQKVNKPLLKSVAERDESQVDSSLACDHDLQCKTTTDSRKRRRKEEKLTAQIDSKSQIDITDRKRKSQTVQHEEKKDEEEISRPKQSKFDGSDDSGDDFEAQHLKEEAVALTSRDLPASPDKKEIEQRSKVETRKRVVRPKGKSGVVAVKTVKKKRGRERASSERNRAIAPSKKQLDVILYGQVSAQEPIPKW